MSELAIRTVGFGSDGEVSIEYMTVPDDFRFDGRLLASHSLTIAECPDYHEEIEDLREAALALLKDAREDFGNTEAVTLPPEEDVNDDGDDGDPD